MADFTWKEILGIGRGVASNAAEGLVSATKGALCPLYDLNPNIMVSGNGLLYRFERRLLAELCGDNTPIPDPPPRQFDGGQCENVQYSLRYYNIKPIGFDGRDGLEIDIDGGLRTWSPPLLGAIKSYTLKVNGQLKTIQQYMADGASPSDDLLYEFQLSGDRPDYTIFLGSGFGIFPVDFVRTDGLPDECGNPPPAPIPVPEPPATELSPTVVVKINNEVDIDYNVSISLEPSGRLTFPPFLIINNIGVTVDVGGITFSPTINIDRSRGNRGGGGFVSPEPTVTEPEPDEETFSEEVEDFLEETVENLVAVKVDIIGIPVNAKISSGGGAPDILYAGWLEFKTDDHYHPRVFLDFARQIFVAPEGANGYALTIKTGFNAQVTKVFQIEDV